MSEEDYSAAASMPAVGVTLSKMIGNMNVVGLGTIIYGALSCLSIVGAIIGIPMIIAGIRAREAADAFSAYDSSGEADSLLRAFERQTSYFFITKVIILMALALTALYIFFAIIAIIAGISFSPNL